MAKNTTEIIKDLRHILLTLPMIQAQRDAVTAGLEKLIEVSEWETDQRRMRTRIWDGHQSLSANASGSRKR